MGKCVKETQEVFFNFKGGKVLLGVEDDANVSEVSRKFLLTKMQHLFL